MRLALSQVISPVSTAVGQPAEGRLHHQLQQQGRPPRSCCCSTQAPTQSQYSTQCSHPELWSPEEVAAQCLGVGVCRFCPL